MLRLLQRKLIIPRGDTGAFSVPVLPNINLNNCTAFFTIFDPRTQKRIFQKELTIDGEIITVRLEHTDTVNLKAGRYYWDIRFWQSPVVVEGEIIDGTEVDSYYTAYNLPECEVRETGDNFVNIDTEPLPPDQIDLLSTSITTSQRNAEIAQTAAEEAVAAAEEIRNGNPSLLGNTFLGNVEATNYASKAYAPNDFVFINNQLYRVTANINAEEEFINGQNCILTTLTNIFSVLYNLISTPNGILTFTSLSEGV